MVQRGFGQLLLLLALALGGSAVSSLAGAPVSAEDDLILRQIGNGFAETDIIDCSAEAGSQGRAFHGELGTVCIIRSAHVGPDQVELMVASMREPDGVDFTIDGVSPVSAQVLDADSENPVYVVGFGVGPHHYSVFFVRSVVAAPSFDAEAFIGEVVRAQVALATRSDQDDPSPAVPPDDTGVRLGDLDPELERLLVDVDGFSRRGPPSPDIHLGAGIEEAGDVSRALTAGTTSVLQFYERDGLLVGVMVSRYRFPLFAAAALGDRSALGIDPSIEVPAQDPIPDLAAIVDDSGHMTGAAFRQGDVFYLLVTAPHQGSTVAQVAEGVEDLAVGLFAAGPGGDSDPFFFASPTEAVVRTLLATAALALLVLALRRLVSPRAIAVVRSPEPSAEVVDASGRAGSIRRRSRALVGIQVLALSVSAAALVVLDAGPGLAIALSASLVAVGSGVVVRLIDRGSLGRTVIFPTAVAVLVGGIAVVALLAGGLLLVRGLTTWWFTPWLSHLEMANDLGIAPATLSQAMFFTGFAFAALGGVLLRMARRLRRGTAERVRQADRRPEVLYLRSFEDDARRIATVASSRRPFLEAFSPRGGEPFEECISWQVERYGPVISVNLPQSSASSLGAAREVLGDDWQSGVIDRMDRARMIVVTLGTSEGLLWEIREIVRRRHLDKTVVVVPPISLDDTRSRWQRFRAVAADAGVPVASGVDPAALLVAVMDSRGVVRGYTADRRDEAGYRAALDLAAESLVGVEPGAGVEPATT